MHCVTVTLDRGATGEEIIQRLGGIPSSWSVHPISTIYCTLIPPNPRVESPLVRGPSSTPVVGCCVVKVATSPVSQFEAVPFEAVPLFAVLGQPLNS